MLNIIRFLRGFVRIRVTGFAPERFLNLCSVHDIELWDISVSENRYEMNLYVSDYFKLKPIVHKTRTKVVLAFQKRTAFFCPQVEKKKDFPAGLSVLSRSVCILFRSFYGTLSSQAETD